MEVDIELLRLSDTNLHGGLHEGDSNSVTPAIIRISEIATLEADMEYHL